MTLAQGLSRVRELINQTDNTNTLWSDTQIGDFLNQGRRLFASILPEEKLPKLKKTASLTVSTFVGSWPTDFLRPLNNPRVTTDSYGTGFVEARKIPEGEKWRLRFLSSNDLTDDSYYYERSDGVVTLTATSINYEYLKIPDDLSSSDSVEMPAGVDDMVIDFAFHKCVGTTRGDKELAVLLWRDIKDELGGVQ